MISARAASIVALATVACGSGSRHPARAPQTAEASDTDMLLSPSDIMSIAHELTRADIDDGAFASQMASDARVLAFARDVVKEESARLYRQEHLMSQMGMSLRGNDLSDQIRNDERRRMDQLKALIGADFDRAYIDAQIDSFRLALDTYDQLIASANDREMKANLAEGRALAMKYLLDARTVRAFLANE